MIFLKWFFRSDLDLSKYWWHRLIKVIFLFLFILITVGTFIELVSEPSEDFLLRSYNIKIRSNLNDYSANYIGAANVNTVSDFFSQEGYFGVIIGSKIKYVSVYGLESVMCVKSPKNSINELSHFIYEKMSYLDKQNTTILKIGNSLSELTKNDDGDGKCLVITSQLPDYLRSLDRPSHNIINYVPSFVYYLEVFLIVVVFAILMFMIYALIYYQLLMYIIYGKRKK